LTLKDRTSLDLGLLPLAYNVLVKVLDTDLAKPSYPFYPSLNGKARYRKPYFLFVAHQVVEVLACNPTGFTLYDRVHRFYKASGAITS
jgi:hypothetical protein